MKPENKMKKNIIISMLLLTAVLFSFGEILHFNDEDFYPKTKGKVFIIDFYADWCPPCKAFAPTFEKVASKLNKYNFAKVDVDKAPNVSNDFKIEYIPFIAAVKDGKFIEQYNGDRTEADFTKWCKKMVGDTGK